MAYSNPYPGSLDDEGGGVGGGHHPLIDAAVLAADPAFTSQFTPLSDLGLQAPDAFDPLSIGWHTALLADHLVAADGSRVDAWADASGNFRVVEAPAAAQRPYLSYGKIGSRKAVTFVGGGTPTLLKSQFPIVNQPASLMVVVSADAAAAQRVVCGLDAGLASSRTLLGISGGGGWFANMGANLLGPTSHTERVSVIIVQYNTTTSVMRVDGVEYEGSVGTTLPNASLILGAQVDSTYPNGANPLEGHVGFVGYLDRLLTEDEIANLEAWATNYYSLDQQIEPRDEAWSWWARPRAVAYKGRTYVSATGRQTENAVSIFTGTDPNPVKSYAGESGGDADDHNNGAIIIEPGRVPILLCSQHAGETLLKWRRGSAIIDDDPLMTEWEAEQTITPNGTVTYPSAHVDSSGDIHVIFRIDLDGWAYTRSTDWGATFGTPIKFLDHTAQCHVASVVTSDDIMRCAVGTHPSQGDEIVRYVEIDLSNGSVTESDGTVLGNVWGGGTNMPLTVVGGIEAVATAPDSAYKWVYDVGDGPFPEIVWSSFKTSDTFATAMYRYSWLDSGTWVTTAICPTGGRFSDASQPYLGGAQIPRNTTGGRVYTSREADDVWYVERQDTADGGVTWTPTVLYSGTTPAVRAWPVESRDGSAPFEVAANIIDLFTLFSDIRSTIGVIGPNRPGQAPTTFEQFSAARTDVDAELNGRLSSSSLDGRYSLRRRDILLSAIGLNGETFARQASPGSAIFATGDIRCTAIGVQEGDIVSNIHVHATVLGSGLTNVKAALLSSAGKVLAVSADLKANFGSVGEKVLPLSAPYTVPADGLVFLALIQVGTTPATLIRGASGIAGFNPTTAAGPALSGAQTGQTDMSVGGTVTITASGTAWWFGWS